jgi:3-oxoacyl-[acyl-carrier protein] reductase
MRILLENKNAIVYGGGGAIGGAVSRAFACERAHLFLAGRTLAKVEAVAEEISAAGGTADAARVALRSSEGTIVHSLNISLAALHWRVRR